MEPTNTASPNFELTQPSLSTVEIRDRVIYHAPSQQGVERHAALSVAFEWIMRNIDVTVPNGREKSLAFTKIEEAKMWASAGVARNPETR